MDPRSTPNPARHSGEHREPAVTALERRISELEAIAMSQTRELKIQFPRIAQLQAEWDIVRHRFPGQASDAGRAS